LKAWQRLEGKIDPVKYKRVLERLTVQLEHAKEWRGVVNTYFYRKTGISDKHGRKIYL